jgi:hypothetical protein
VAIAERIEQAMAGRHGGDRKSSGKCLPLDPAAGKSTDLAASAVGWSGEQYRQAKRVTKEADPETKAAGSLPPLDGLSFKPRAFNLQAIADARNMGLSALRGLCRALASPPQLGLHHCLLTFQDAA